jgi:transposase InsO family protein
MFAVAAIASCDDKEGTDKQLDSLWLDGGSTHHVTHRKEMLYHCEASPVRSVLGAGGECHEVHCCGRLLLSGPNGGKVILSDVLCVPSFHVNLVSETQLMRHGVTIFKADGQAVLTDVDGCVFMKGHIVSQLCELDHKLVPPPQEGLARSYAATLSWDVYHQRLGHPSMEATKKLLRSNAASVCTMTAYHLMSLRMIAKLATQQNRREQVSTSLRQEQQNLLNSYIQTYWVLSKCPAWEGISNVATLLDDFSGYGEVFCMKDKKSVQVELIEAIVRFQRQSGYQCKGIRTDRGKEYMGKLSVFLRRKGIIHERSTAYTPEQNGLAERYNRTLIERTRALLLHQNLPTMLWGDAMSTAAYLLNYIPKRDSDETPWESFFGKKPSVSHLRTFGCQEYVHLPTNLRDNKTDAVSQQALFIGYAQNCKAWRLNDTECTRLPFPEPRGS